MSHYALTKVKIKNPNVQLLKKAIMNVAKRRNLQTTEWIEDWYGNKQKVNPSGIGLKSDIMYRGVEIYINDKGEVVVGGDFYGYKSEVEQLQNELAQEYTAEALRSYGVASGYVVQKQYVEQKNRHVAIEVVGVGY